MRRQSTNRKSVSNTGDENSPGNRKNLAARLSLEKKANRKKLRINKKKELLSKIAKRSHNDNEKMVTCPECNMTAWPEQVEKKICCKTARTILKPIMQVSEDVFSTGRVINGGGYGMGKSRKH